MTEEIYELLDSVRKMPNAYLDERSLKSLRTFLSGYDAAFASIGRFEDMSGQLRPFNEWVAKELGFSNSTRGWHNMISMKAESEEKSFDLFFELLEKFKKTT